MRVILVFAITLGSAAAYVTAAPAASADAPCFPWDGCGCSHSVVWQIGCPAIQAAKEIKDDPSRAFCNSWYCTSLP